MGVFVFVTGGLVRSLNRPFILTALVLANLVVLAQTQKPTGLIRGIIQSAGTPLPGVAVTATNAATNEKVSTSTDLNGQYLVKVPELGRYTVETSMAAF